MAKLKGKTAVVTGGSRGIGKAVATRLAQEGASVALSYHGNPQAADALAAELSARGVRAQAFRADVTDPQASRRFMDEVAASFGGLDILVSNAGIEHFGALEDITPEDFDRVYSVNARGQFFSVQAAARHMKQGGRLVMTSSISASASIFHHTLYASSKAAVEAMVRNLAPELGTRGITINAIAPGGTQTDMAAESAKHYTHPALKGVPPEVVLQSMCALGRLARPEEIAAAVAFLVADDSSYVTGSTLTISGGWM